MSPGQLGQPVASGDLIAELAARALAVGANAGAWPGLTIYRFTAPTGPSWEEIQSLSLCVVAQGRKAVTVAGETYLYDPFHYLVLSSHLHFEAEIPEASPNRPFLSFVLQIDPALVRRVSSDMLERRTTAFRSRLGAGQRRTAGRLSSQSAQGSIPPTCSSPSDAHGSSPSRALISSASVASTRCKVRSPGPSGPPRMTKPSSTSASMNAACSSQPSWRRIGRVASQPGPWTSVTAKVAMPGAYEPVPTAGPARAGPGRRASWLTRPAPAHPSRG
jgi:AraC-type transcriptional regulator N-terminus